MGHYGVLKQEFGIKDKEVSILLSLKYEKLDAKDICSKTKIPKGRIYEHLNSLLEKGLIERTEKRPFSYFISNEKNNILLFMKDRIDKMTKAQSEIIELMRGKGKDHIERIEDSQRFTSTHLNMISSSKVFNVIGLHGSFPYFLYPSNFDDFVKLRKLISEKRETITFTDIDRCLYVFNTYRKAFENGIKINVIFEKQTCLNHIKMISSGLGKKFLKKMFTEAIKRIEGRAGDVYVIDEYLPFQIDFNEKCVSVSVRHKGLTNGLLIYNPDAVKIYSDIFEQHKKRAKPLAPILKKMIKEIESK